MKWKCDMCGACCRHYDVFIDKEDEDALLPCCNDNPEFLEEESRRLKKRNGACIFLDEENLCKIHRACGFEAKPKACRAFPGEDGIKAMFCGVYLDAEMPENAARPKKGFFIDGKIMSADALFHAIRRAWDSGNYAGAWKNFILNAGKISGREIKKEDIDRIMAQKTPKHHMQLSFTSKAVLARHSSDYAKAWSALSFGGDARLFLPTGEFVLRKDAKDVKIERDALESFFLILSSGFGIIYESDFPAHLKFAFECLELFAKNMAFQNGKRRAGLIDVINAYAKLNGIFKFR